MKLVGNETNSCAGPGSADWILRQQWTAIRHLKSLQTSEALYRISDPLSAGMEQNTLDHKTSIRSSLSKIGSKAEYEWKWTVVDTVVL